MFNSRYVRVSGSRKGRRERQRERNIGVKGGEIQKLRAYKRNLGEREEGREKERERERRKRRVAIDGTGWRVC